MTGEAPPELVMVRVLQDLEPFMGEDGRTYSLRREDVVTLPRSHAGPLVERGAAVEIVTEVLETSKIHQEGRVTPDVTNVTKEPITATLAPDVLESMGKPLPELSPEEVAREMDLPIEAPHPVALPTLRLKCSLERDNFITQYITYWSARTDAYPEFMHMGAVTLLSIAADRKVIIPLIWGDVHLNTWTMGLGISGMARKSTVLTPTSIIANAEFADRALPGSFSPEAFLEMLDTQSHRFYIKDECAQILQAVNKKPYMADFRDLLAELFDCKSVSRVLRTSKKKGEKTTFNAVDPYITLAWATTPINFENTATLLDIKSGYLARFLYYNPRYSKAFKGAAMATERMGMDLRGLGTQFGKIWRAVAQLKGMIFWVDEESLSAFNLWYEKMQKEYFSKNNDLEATVLSRVAPYVFKLAALYYLGSAKFLDDVARMIPRYTIPTNHFKKALEDVSEYFMPIGIGILSQVDASQSENIQKKIVQALTEARGQMTMNELNRKLKQTKKVLYDNIDALVESDMIAVTTKETKGRPLTTITLLRMG